MAKNATSTIFDLIKVIVLLVVGVFVFLFVRDKYLKSQDEKQKDKEFEDRGALASFGRFLFGNNAFDNSTPNTAEKEAEQKQQKDLEEIERLNDLAQKQAKEEEERRKQAERQAQKDVNVDPNKDVAARIDEIEKTIKHQQELEKKTGKKEETFDRTKDDLRIFRFSEPIKTSKGTIVDFAVKVGSTGTTTKEQRAKTAEAARTQAKQAGFTLGKDKLGRELTPIHTLSQKTLEKIAKSPTLQKSLELAQKRRLGLR